MVHPCFSSSGVASSSDSKCCSAAAPPSASSAAGIFLGCPLGASMRATPLRAACAEYDTWRVLLWHK